MFECVLLKLDESVLFPTTTGTKGTAALLMVPSQVLFEV